MQSTMTANRLKMKKKKIRDPELNALVNDQPLPMSISAKPRSLSPAEYSRIDFGDCTETQRRFVEEYVKDWNQTRAYQRAGLPAKTFQSAAVRASQLIRNVNVLLAIKQCQDFLTRKTLVTKERLITETARLAFSDVRDYSNGDGTVRNVHELDDDSAAAIKKIEQIDYFEGDGDDRQKLGVTKKMELHDKLGAINSLNKLMGYNPSEKHEVSGSIQHDHRHLHVGLNWDDMPVELLRKIKGEVDARRQLLTDETKPR